MTPRRTYLDYNATAPLRPEARAAMIAALDAVGNPSSVHAEGRAARSLVERAREQVAALVGAVPSEIVFTSGATEANNWVMHAGWNRVVVAAQEHLSILDPARRSGAIVTELPSRQNGVVDLAMLGDAVPGFWPERSLMSLQMANGETGVIQPLAAAVALVPDHVLVHSDAVQASGRMVIDFAALALDLMSISSHKLGGPKGVGALVVRDRVDLPPLVSGGGQERRRRAGTENVAAIAGFGAAAAAAASDLAAMARIAAMRDRMERELLRLGRGAVVIGRQGPRLPNTSCIALPGRAAETLVIRLDLSGIAVSAGAACSSGKVGPSHVLAAMALAPEIARSAVRVSLGHATTDADIDAFLAACGRMNEPVPAVAAGNRIPGALVARSALAPIEITVGDV